MTGFPGETDQDFESLLAFVEDVRFDHLGAFVYSDFKDLPSHHLPDHIPSNVAKKRYDRLMSLQQKIAMENNQLHIGRMFKVLVEAEIENDLYVGRTFFQAPEIDGVTYVRSRNGRIGDFVNVRINDALEYDLIGQSV